MLITAHGLERICGNRSSLCTTDFPWPPRLQLGGEYFAFPASRSSLWRRADHHVVELCHECALIWSGVVSERLRLFDQDLFRVCAKYFHGLLDEVLQRHGPRF